MAIPASYVVVFTAVLCSCLLVRTSADEACGRSPAPGSGRPQRNAQTETGLPAGFPWHVLVYKNKTSDKTSERLYICGGSLIKPRWAVFAAHCFMNAPRPELYGASLGKTVRSWDSVEVDEQHRMIKRIFTKDLSRHRGHSANDIALVEFDQDVTINTKVWPICVDLSSAPTPLQKGDEGIMAGYDRSGIGKGEQPKDLKYARLRFFGDWDECRKAVRKQRSPLAWYLDGKDKFCVDALEGSAIGRGDSAAGFAMTTPDGRWYLKGVTSVGNMISSLTFFTNVTTHASWMSDTMKQ